MATTTLGRVRRLLRILLAFILILVGAVFVVTPLVPGWPVMAIGLSLLAPDYAWARRLLQRFQRGKKQPEGTVPSALSPVPGPPRPGQ